MATIPNTPRPSGDDDAEEQITYPTLADAQALDAIMNSPYFLEGLEMGTVPSTDPSSLDNVSDTGSQKK